MKFLGVIVTEVNEGLHRKVLSSHTIPPNVEMMAIECHQIKRKWFLLGVYVFALRPLLFLYRGGRSRALSSACKSDQVDFTDWMSFLTPNLMEEIILNTEALNANT